MILVLGGTKSGKSSFASRRAVEREEMGSVVYLATARAGDDEMKERIRRHQADRPATWKTVEEELHIAAWFENIASAAPGGTSPATVLVDCLTLWLTNLLAPLGDEPDRMKALAIAENEGEGLKAAIGAWEAGAPAGTGARRQAVLVSNQVETGLVSPWPLGRVFQDIAGLTHQKFAAASSEVYLMCAGLPQRLK